LGIFDSSNLRLEVDIELFKEFLIFIFWRNDLNGVTQLSTEQHEGVFIYRLRCVDHFTKVKERGNEHRWVCIDAISKVSE